jgi:hypothetical protein
MPLPLPKPIELFMSSEHTPDTDALAECFASDATVQDEGQTLKGLKAIKAWRLATAKKYQHTLEPIAASARGGKTVVSTKLTAIFRAVRSRLISCSRSKATRSPRWR